MKMKKNQAVTLVKITSTSGKRDIAATIEHLASTKSPSEVISLLKQFINQDIGSDTDSWQSVQRPTIHIDYAEDKQLALDLKFSDKKVPPIVSHFECNTISELEDFINSHSIKTPISELEISFTMKNKSNGTVIKYVARNFSDDTKYNGRVKGLLVRELESKGIAFYKEFKEIF